MKFGQKMLVSAAVLIALVSVAGCKKKVAPVAPPPPAVAAPAPTAQITATPTSISSGDQVTLTWKTTDATSVSIDGLGDVPSSGVKTVTPTESTTYHLVAKGDGGSAEASARVTVNPPPAVAVPTNTMSEEEEFRANVQDIFYDYDTYDILFQGPVRGLSQGGEVHFNGIKVGEVTKIALDRTNPARVIARTRVTSDVPIRVDSYATLEPQGITGVNYVQITAGTPSKPLLKDTVPRDQVPVIRSQRSTLSDLLEGVDQYRGGYYDIYERWFGASGYLFYPLDREVAKRLAGGRMWLN